MTSRTCGPCPAPPPGMPVPPYASANTRCILSDSAHIPSALSSFDPLFLLSRFLRLLRAPLCSSPSRVPLQSGRLPGPHMGACCHLLCHGVLLILLPCLALAPCIIPCPSMPPPRRPYHLNLRSCYDLFHGHLPSWFSSLADHLSPPSVTFQKQAPITPFSLSKMSVERPRWYALVHSAAACWC